MIAGDWPKWSAALQEGVGIRNQILGTGLLMLMTSLISLPFGVGAGVFLSEYARGGFGNFTRFVITSLRSISMLILGFTALSLVKASSGTPLAFLFKGYQFDGFVWRENQGGTFFAASLVISLLVIPVICRATEEGCRSLPNELREGSLALGGSEETTLWRIVLPWSLANIVTGVLLGCAEAAGDMAILMFIAGRGDYGVGPFKQVTSLAYMVFDIWFGEKSFHDTMSPYQFSAGLILITMTVGLGLIALLLKRWLALRHRGR
jgi:phosphate transport system permease protein